MSLGSDLVREARRRAGLTQAALAARLGTSQPGVARWESGRAAIGLDDLRRVVQACGLDLELALVPADDSDLAQARRLSHLSGQERIERHASVARQLRAVRAARGA